MKHFLKTIALFASILATGTLFAQGGGGVKNGFLGVKTEKDSGAKITAISPGSPAEKAGLAQGDIIAKIGDMTVTSPEELSEAVKSFKSKDKVTISYIRNNKNQEVTATLAKCPRKEMIYN